MITRTTLAKAIRTVRAETREHAHSYANPYDEGRKSTRDDIRTQAVLNVLPAFAWPGGYPVAYYPVERDQCTGDVLCNGCALTDLLTRNTEGVIPDIVQEVEDGPLRCDQCCGLIFDREED